MCHGVQCQRAPLLYRLFATAGFDESVDENGSWEAIVARKLDRPAWHCGSAARQFERDARARGFLQVRKGYFPELVLIHPIADLDEHERKPIRSPQHLFASSSMN